MFSLRLGGHIVPVVPTSHDLIPHSALAPGLTASVTVSHFLPSILSGFSSTFLTSPYTAITARHRDLSNTPYLKADFGKQYIGRGTSLDSKRTGSEDGILVDDECTTQLRTVKVSVRVALRRACARYVAVPTTTS